VDGIATHLAHDLRNQYTIAYSPSDEKRDGTFRAIKVIVSAPAKAVVRTRTGYFACGGMLTCGRLVIGPHGRAPIY
jgi:hypothetical protein